MCINHGLTYWFVLQGFVPQALHSWHTESKWPPICKRDFQFNSRAWGRMCHCYFVSEDPVDNNSTLLPRMNCNCRGIIHNLTKRCYCLSVIICGIGLGKFCSIRFFTVQSNMIWIAKPQSGLWYIVGQISDQYFIPMVHEVEMRGFILWFAEKNDRKIWYKHTLSGRCISKYLKVQNKIWDIFHFGQASICW